MCTWVEVITEKLKIIAMKDTEFLNILHSCFLAVNRALKMGPEHSSIMVGGREADHGHGVVDGHYLCCQIGS